MITDRTKTFALIAACYFVVSFVVLGGMFYEMQRMSTTFEAQTTLIQESAAQRQQYNDLLRKVEETEEERAQLQEYILTEADTISFLTEIERLARSSGVELSTQSLDVAEVEASPYESLRIVFAVEGSLATLQELIGVLESLPYHGTVTDVTLDESGAGFDGTVSVALSIVTYD